MYSWTFCWLLKSEGCHVWKKGKDDFRRGSGLMFREMMARYDCHQYGSSNWTDALMVLGHDNEMVSLRGNVYLLEVLLRGYWERCISEGDL
ncbi:hypothetical protein CDAR_286741 [Caerostris darwini]|uniref:Uncharacterized protein n=1 Tax=Caerostris darwini TaxID=1538125 RepID=A0AAV4RAN0_9ARAC|nr:hypothetical protein CDAR_286741 [Caerostris darwini]